jgi:glycosyltransferase involved in cell wall biosynthesis
VRTNVCSRTCGVNTTGFISRPDEANREIEAASSMNPGPPAVEEGSTESTSPTGQIAVKVFVFLGYGFGADSWKKRFAKHQIPGLNERLPYGYFHAGGDGWDIQYSQDRDEGLFARFMRRTLGHCLGFDLVHAWSNRAQLRTAEVVWTHTEREHLAALLLYRLLRVKKPPKLIAQCIWLFDQWPCFSLPRRWFYRKLLRGADIITTQSPEDLAAVRRLLPSATTELVLSGAAVESLIPARKCFVHRPIRLAALGNDIHRDWQTLVHAFQNDPVKYDIRIASTKIDRDLLKGLAQFSIVRASTENEIKMLYEWADIVVVPLKLNLHASGITVIFEAVASGVPVVCTDVGGLRAYFSDQDISYVMLKSPHDMRRVVDLLAENDDLRFERASNAQRRLFVVGLTKQGYAQRHRRLSESLLSSEPSVGGERVPGNGVPRVDRATPSGVKVFVHLGHGFGSDGWQRRYSAGLIPGLNEPLPYGYHRAGDDRWLIEYSKDADESPLIQLLRRSLQRLVGFDLLHAWRNRRQIAAADIVWTHTEREHLAILFLKRLRGERKHPAVIAQSVWLFDVWPRLPAWKRRLYLRLLRQADLITTMSPANLALACALFPQKDCRAVLFGIGSKGSDQSARRRIEKPIRILALGNDMHRDWQTLLAAFGGMADYRVCIGSNAVPLRQVSGLTNFSLLPATSKRDLTALYSWADVVVVPLKENSHASGITVVLEATLFGLPVVCAYTGGLAAYFSNEHLRYVPVADSHAMKAAVDEIAENDVLRQQLVSRAQNRIVEENLTAQGFAERYRKLSEELLFGSQAITAEQSPDTGMNGESPSSDGIGVPQLDTYLPGNPGIASAGRLNASNRAR